VNAEIMSVRQCKPEPKNRDGIVAQSDRVACGAVAVALLLHQTQWLVDGSIGEKGLVSAEQN
jgi:hypothetical protein